MMRVISFNTHNNPRAIYDCHNCLTPKPGSSTLSLWPGRFCWGAEFKNGCNKYNNNGSCVLGHYQVPGAMLSTFTHYPCFNLKQCWGKPMWTSFHKRKQEHQGPSYTHGVLHSMWLWQAWILVSPGSDIHVLNHQKTEYHAFQLTKLRNPTESWPGHCALCKSGWYSLIRL